jgi:large subunit ribosomal protein L15
MQLDRFEAPRGRKWRKRVGRGLGSGNGKTAGKGGKGQTARTGKGKPRRGYEGGQMPMFRRIPKRGFNNIFAKTYAEINVGTLEKLESGTAVTAELLKEKGLIKKICAGIRVLGKGTLTKKLNVTATHVSAGAKTKIESAGGSVTLLPTSA